MTGWVSRYGHEVLVQVTWTLECVGVDDGAGERLRTWLLDMLLRRKAGCGLGRLEKVCRVRARDGVKAEEYFGP